VLNSSGRLSGRLGAVLLAFGVLVPRFQLSVNVSRCLLSSDMIILTFRLSGCFVDNPKLQAEIKQGVKEDKARRMKEKAKKTR
jgi:hypothetical protein